VLLCIFCSTHCLNTVCKVNIFYLICYLLKKKETVNNLKNNWNKIMYMLEIITEETSNGSMKIINREKYQAINTEIVTAM